MFVEEYMCNPLTFHLVTCWSSHELSQPEVILTCGGGGGGAPFYAKEYKRKKRDYICASCNIDARHCHPALGFSYYSLRNYISVNIDYIVCA